MTGSEDQTVRVWDAKTGKPFFLYHSHNDIVWANAYSSDGKCFAFGDYEGYLQLWQKT